MLYELNITWKGKIEYHEKKSISKSIIRNWSSETFLLLLIARLIFPRLINHENRTISNEIDEIREYEGYRSNLDKCQELIPAVRVDEENETILLS